jgi:hypothetical protein
MIGGRKKFTTKPMNQLNELYTMKEAEVKERSRWERSA